MDGHTFELEKNVAKKFPLVNGFEFIACGKSKLGMFYFYPDKVILDLNHPVKQVELYTVKTLGSLTHTSDIKI